MRDGDPTEPRVGPAAAGDRPHRPGDRPGPPAPPPPAGAGPGEAEAAPGGAGARPGEAESGPAASEAGAGEAESGPEGDPGRAEAGPGPLGPAWRPSTAIVTAPNAVTLVRLLLMPVCALLLARGSYLPGLLLTALVGSTDWVDGWLARRTGTVSRLGQLLDPLADRLLIASVAIALLLRGVLPWPAVLLLVARDVVLLAGWPLLRRWGVEPPEVVWVGKAATFVLLLALPTLTLGATGLAVAPLAKVLGLALLWFGVALYYLAGAVYVRMAVERLGERTAAGS